MWGVEADYLREGNDGLMVRISGSSGDVGWFVGVWEVSTISKQDLRRARSGFRSYLLLKAFTAVLGIDQDLGSGIWMMAFGVPGLRMRMI